LAPDKLRALDETTAAAILNVVFDSGINFIDTSIEGGRSEELIGRSSLGDARSISSFRSAGACPMALAACKMTLARRQHPVIEDDLVDVGEDTVGHAKYSQ